MKDALYREYKSKYLALKQQLGGVIEGRTLEVNGTVYYFNEDIFTYTTSGNTIAARGKDNMYILETENSPRITFQVTEWNPYPWADATPPESFQPSFVYIENQYLVDRYNFINLKTGLVTKLAELVTWDDAYEPCTVAFNPDNSIMALGLCQIGYLQRRKDDKIIFIDPSTLQIIKEVIVTSRTPWFDMGYDCFFKEYFTLMQSGDDEWTMTTWVDWADGPFLPDYDSGTVVTHNIEFKDITKQYRDTFEKYWKAYWKAYRSIRGEAHDSDIEINKPNMKLFFCEIGRRIIKGRVDNSKKGFYKFIQGTQDIVQEDLESFIAFVNQKLGSEMNNISDLFLKCLGSWDDLGSHLNDLS